MSRFCLRAAVRGLGFGAVCWLASINLAVGFDLSTWPAQVFFPEQAPVALASYSCPNCNRCDTCPSAVAPGEAQPGQNYFPGEMQSEQFAGLGGNGLTVNDAAGGYIDNPIVGTWFRLRYDAAFNNTRPDRAEFFYAKYGNSGGPGPRSPIVNGVPISPASVDYEVLSPYFEYQIWPRVSIFAETPVQRVEMTTIDSSIPANIVIKNSGIADINFGFKYALYCDPCQYLTFQCKWYVPTGDATRGLGNALVGFEPGFLYLGRLSNRAYFQGELRPWIPIGGTDFAAIVWRYGAGIGYDLVRTYDSMGPLNPYVSQGLRITAVTEFVGWTVASGFSTPPNTQGPDNTIDPDPARGDTIVNLKLGVRVTHGLGSIYTGWGHAITSDAWYEDLFRLEYRRMF